MSSTVLLSEWIKSDKNIAEKGGMRPRYWPQSIILMQELFSLTGQCVEKSRYIYLIELSDHPGNNGSQPLIEKD